MSSVIKCIDVNYSYKDGNYKTDILKNLQLEVPKSTSIAILGQSGCGKSTLLNLLGAMDIPTNGKVLIANTDTKKLNETQKTKLRAKHLSFVYQFHHLLDNFSALENVAMPLLIRGDNKKTAFDEATKLLADVNLENRLKHLPAQLSGGERQRVAIARALITRPECLLADEPTGNLDTKNSNDIIDMMITLNKSHNSSLIIVTHDERIAQKMEKILILKQGKLHLA